MKYVFRGCEGIAVAGCGGTGSRVLTYLAELNCALRMLGGKGFRVHAFDPDVVSETNLGRQKFFGCDVGKNKAQVLIQRINMCYGFDWVAYSGKYESYHCPFLIGCVDSRKSRSGFYVPEWYIDCGNGSDYGQVLFQGPKMPRISEEYPDLFNGALDDPSDGPSCSAAEALLKQKLFVNAWCAMVCGEMVRSLYMEGGLDYRGVFFNVRNMMISRKV